MIFDRNKLPRPREFSRSLYTFDIGQNDLIAGFRKLTRAQLKAAFPDIINQLSAAVIVSPFLQKDFFYRLYDLIEFSCRICIDKGQQLSGFIMRDRWGVYHQPLFISEIKNLVF